MSTLILLPGMACDAALWRHQLGALAGNQPVVSDVLGRADTLPAMAALLLAEHPGELVLAGCSMGGMLALEAQRQAPNRMRGLAVLGSSARPDTPALLALRSQAIAQFEAGMVEPLIRVNAMFAFHPRNAARLVDDYVAMVLRAGTAGLIRQNRALMTRVDLRAQLGAVACPVLVVGGADDQLTPPECAREIAAGVPGATLHLLADCGHVLTWEQPAAVSALLQNWLAGLGVSASAGPAGRDDRLLESRPFAPSRRTTRLAPNRCPPIQPIQPIMPIMPIMP